MKKILIILAFAIAAVSCGNRHAALLPNISGKAGEIIVVMDKNNWEGQLGNDVRALLGSDCPYLPIREPLYSLVNISPTALDNLFKVHRNIVYFDIDPQVAETKVSYLANRWAAPQALVYISAPDSRTADSLLNAGASTVVNYIEQAERDRIISNNLHYEEISLAQRVQEVFGGSPHFPTGYKLKKSSDDFIWIADEKQYTMQGVFVYRYPAEGDGSFSLEKIIAHRNETLKANVPGMFENTYMTTGDIPAPSVEFLKYKGRDFAQTRGWWEVENDYMAGPFVSHSFYSPDGKDIIVAEAFVYAPKYDKRQYLRQVESILYSWEWKKAASEDNSKK